MTTQLRRIRQKFGLNDRPVTDTMDLSELGLQTREDLDALREAAIEDQQRTGGASKLYHQWVEAERRGLGEQLPSLRDMEGLGTTGDEIYAETLQAARSSRQAFDPARMDERLRGLELQGVPMADWDAHALRDQLSMAMAETADANTRAGIMELISAVDNSPSGSLTASIQVNMPDPVQTYEVPSEQEKSGDWYQDQMMAAQERESEAMRKQAQHDQLHLSKFVNDLDLGLGLGHGDSGTL